MASDKHATVASISTRLVDIAQALDFNARVHKSLETHASYKNGSSVVLWVEGMFLHSDHFLYDFWFSWEESTFFDYIDIAAFSYKKV